MAHSYMVVHAHEMHAYKYLVSWAGMLATSRGAADVPKIEKVPEAWRMSWRRGLGTQVVFLQLATPSSSLPSLDLMS
jgi:hypothetical protein